MTLIKAWEENEKPMADNKAYTKISAIGPWENTKSATIEADLKQIEADIETEKPKEREKMKNKMEAIHKEAEEKTGTFAMLFQGTFVNPFKKHSYSSCNGVPLGDIGRRCGLKTPHRPESKTTAFMEEFQQVARLEWHAPVVCSDLAVLSNEKCSTGNGGTPYTYLGRPCDHWESVLLQYMDSCWNSIGQSKRNKGLPKNDETWGKRTHEGKAEHFVHALIDPTQKGRGCATSKPRFYLSK
ncbi:remorin-like protein [Tanacetum coccineum]